MSSAPILIADRNTKMVSLLRQLLQSEGYRVLAAAKGELAIQLTAKEQPALAILNVDLAGEIDGYEAVRRIREFSEVPIIMLSLYGESEAVLRGFDLGADDYVITPMDPKILLARARALLKRCRTRVASPAEIVCSDLVIDLAAHRVSRAGVEIYLTDTEYHLLLELARYRDRVLMHEQLLEAVWGNEYRNEVGYLRSYIHILRRKLESDPSQPRLIVSRPGIGYMLNTAHRDSAGD